ncbi:hypothetical protein BH24ACT5_BH24ACT5_06040 [soil metagenome]
MQDPSSPDGSSPDDDVTLSVRKWVAAWGAEVAGVDMATARARFSPDVVSFGTHAGMVHGIDALHDQQWSNIWPQISEFEFLLDELSVLASPDGLQAVAVVPWSSMGRNPAGDISDRPGQATVVLRRATADDAWLGVHTHFSLRPASSP